MSEQLFDLNEMPLNDLIDASREELSGFAKGEPGAGGASLELFRRALVLDDAVAWEAIWEQYAEIVRGAINRHSASALVEESDEYWIARTLQRFWMGVRAQRLNQFPDLAALLKYLKMCASSVMLDEVRARRASRPISLDEIPEEPATADAEQAVVGQLAAEELWQSLRRELQDEVDQVAYLSIAHALKPTEVFALRPDLFQSVSEVYRVKRDVLKRLRRSSAIRAFLEKERGSESDIASAPNRTTKPPRRPSPDSATHRTASAAQHTDRRATTSGSDVAVRVFLCHSSGDKPAVRELYQRLISEKWILPWLDEEDLLPGQKWEDEIRRAVSASHAVIVCLSRASMSKAGYINREIKYALDEADKQPEDTIFLIPLRLDDCDVPDRLRGWHWVNHFDKRGYDRLIQALKRRAETVGIIPSPPVAMSTIQTAMNVRPHTSAPVVRPRSARKAIETTPETDPQVIGPVPQEVGNEASPSLQITLKVGAAAHGEVQVEVSPAEGAPDDQFTFVVRCGGLAETFENVTLARGRNARNVVEVVNRESRMVRVVELEGTGTLAERAPAYGTYYALSPSESSVSTTILLPRRAW